MKTEKMSLDALKANAEVVLTKEELVSATGGYDVNLYCWTEWGGCMLTDGYYYHCGSFIQTLDGVCEWAFGIPAWAVGCSDSNQSWGQSC